MSSLPPVFPPLLLPPLLFTLFQLVSEESSELPQAKKIRSVKNKKNLFAFMLVSLCKNKDFMTEALYKKLQMTHKLEGSTKATKFQA